MLQQERWLSLQRKADLLWQRSWDRHLRLAVTGLTRSGKTAFVTALIHQLEQAGFSARLPHWQVLQQEAMEKLAKMLVPMCLLFPKSLRR